MKTDLKRIGFLISAALIWQLPQAHANVSGAIFTTISDGTIVNANTQYTSKCDVYLNGGPGVHARAGAAGLPDGLYYFQVTDPDGKTLLSTDPVSNRQFQVTGGVITAYTGTGGPVHPTGIDVPHASSGAITISLANTSCPTDFLDSPNNGGIYKVWVTPKSSFIGDPTQVDNLCGGGCYHGFDHNASKTDNFKVAPTLVTFCLSVTVLNPDGMGGLLPAPSWPITVVYPDGTSNNKFTGDGTLGTTVGVLSVCGLPAGTYTATETPSPYVVIGVTFDGMTAPSSPSYSFTWAAGNPTPAIVFTNGQIL